MQGKLPWSRRRVLSVISDSGSIGVSTLHIANVLGLPVNCVSGRITELAEHGLVKDSGLRCINPSGKRATLWIKATPTKPFEFDEFGQGVFL